MSCPSLKSRRSLPSLEEPDAGGAGERKDMRIVRTDVSEPGLVRFDPLPGHQPCPAGANEPGKPLPISGDYVGIELASGGIDDAAPPALQPFMDRSGIRVLRLQQKHAEHIGIDNHAHMARP